MTREKLQKLILKDDLKGIIDILLTESAKSNVAKSLNGRLIELNKQNNLGTIGREAYNIERNRIRASLIELAEDESLSSTIKSSSTLFQKIGAFLLIPILIGGVVYAFYAKSTASGERSDDRELVTNDTTITTDTLITTDTTTTIPPKPPLVINDIKSPISYQLNNLSFNTKKEYRKGLGYLHKQYSWKVDVPISVRPEDIKMEYQDSTKIMTIQVQKVLISNSIHIKNKKTRVLKNSLWIEPNSEDGAFWQGINGHATSKLNSFLKGSTSSKSRIKNYYTNTFKSKIKELNPELPIEEVTFKINFDKFQFHNGGFVGF